MDLMRNVSEGSLRNIGKANRVGSPLGRTSGNSLLGLLFLPPGLPNGGLEELAVMGVASIGSEGPSSISLRSSSKIRKKQSKCWF